MTLDRHPDWYTVVRTHWRRTTGFLLASREPCLGIRQAELRAVRGRALASRDVNDLLDWKPPESWLLAVILCPGDAVQPVLDWVRKHKADPSRVWFFVHRDTDIVLLHPWADAGFPTDQVDVVSTWQALHKLFGLALNDRVYADWKDIPA